MSNLATQNIELASLSDLTKASLLDKQVAGELVEVAHNIAQQKKDVDAQYDAIKDRVKEMFADEIEAEQNVAIYNWEIGSKLTLTPRGGGLEIDDEELMKAIYAAFGEDLDNRDGSAWAAFCEVSDPVPCPRKVNSDKLAEVLSRAEAAKDAKHASATVTQDMVAAATITKKPTYAASCSTISKAELAEHEKGELQDPYVVKAR